MSNSSKAGSKSRRSPGRQKGGEKGVMGGQIDILCAYDTSFPCYHNPRKGAFKGNGPRPANPFGRPFKKPDVG